MARERYWDASDGTLAPHANPAEWIVPTRRVVYDPAAVEHYPPPPIGRSILPLTPRKVGALCLIAGCLLVAARLLAGDAATNASTPPGFPGILGGNFETTCNYVRSLQVDPIVSPGIVPSAHLHDFFGNRNIDQNSTPASALGGSTSCSIPQNASGYWAPSAIRTDTAAYVKPETAFAYYFGTSGTPTVPIPAGLELVAGNAHATSPPGRTVLQFSCGNGGSFHSPVRAYPYNCLTEPNIVSSGVMAAVLFPYCWDGAGVGQADVAYGDSVTGRCPAGTKTLPQLQLHVRYGEAFQRGDLLAFSSGPYWTFHADYLDAWNQPKMDSLNAGCTAIYKKCGFLNTNNPGP